MVIADVCNSQRSLDRVLWSLGECSNIFSLDFGQLVVVRDTVIHHRADNWKKRSVFHSATFHSRLYTTNKNNYYYY